MAFEFMNFEDDLNRELAPKFVNPFVDKDGNPLPDGALHNPAADADKQPPPRKPPVSFSPRVVRPLGGQVMDFASMGPMGQAGVMNDMTSGINNLVGAEMDSRVAQAREERQRQHEKELMAMRMQAMRAQNEGDIIRSLLNG